MKKFRLLLSLSCGILLAQTGSLQGMAGNTERDKTAGPGCRVDILVCPSETMGPIKAVNGGNLAPPLADEAQPGGSIREAFARMNIPITRLHDAPLENPGMRLVDIPLIFANPKADVSDPDNYYFAQTDDYIKNCIDCGTPVYYRLGTSIEHSVNKYFVHPPADVGKWIDVASNIIRHYTEGKWNGFRYDIRYWEIWNEPDLGPQMWTGTQDEFNGFYAQVATALKGRFPHLKFGGPAHCVPEEGRLRAFLAKCAERGAPLDFYSYHLYAPDDKAILQTPSEVRRLLDEYGYTDTEIHLNEWHYNPRDGAFWAAGPERQAEWIPSMRGLEAAAFINTVMIGWQDTPLDRGFYYTVTTTRWGLFEHGKPVKTYYGMQAFGDLARHYETRIQTQTSGLPDGSRVLAGKNSRGDVAILVACWKSGPGEWVFRLPRGEAYARAEAYLLDETRDLERVLETTETERPVTIRTESGSGVILVKFRKR